MSHGAERGHGPVPGESGGDGGGIAEVVDTLHLEPGDLATALHVPAPSPLPPGEATVFPPAADDDDAVPPPTGYRARKWAVLVNEVREADAASLARLVSGKRGLILFCASRGDDRDEIAGQLGITIEAVEAILAGDDGHHVTRSDR